MKRISEDLKIDVGLASQALAAPGVVAGAYHPSKDYRYWAVLLSVGALAAGETVAVEFLQAQDAAGTGSKGIPTTLGQVAIATITANVLVTVFTITVGVLVIGDKVTINGLEYTAAAATDATKREFLDAAGLETCLNHAVYGVPGMTATNVAGVVTCVSTIPGEKVFTVVGTVGTLDVATVSAQAYIDLDTASLSEHFCHLAVQATSTAAATTLAAVLLRSNSRYAITQRVAASALIQAAAAV